MKYLFCLPLAPMIGFSQVTDDFSDGDFASNPAWIGHSASWSVSETLQLQSAHQQANSSFYLATPMTLTGALQWEWYCKLDFNTSGANYADVFLTASGGDFNASTTTGYFVRIGNTEDEISLYHRQTGGVDVKLIDGINGVTNKSSNQLRIKVTRNENGAWRLLRDATGTGNAFRSEGSVTDTSFIGSLFFGFSVRQSTAAFFNRHYFDDINISRWEPDLLAPIILNSTVTSATSVSILFSEAVDDSGAVLLANYEVSNGIGNPVSATRDPINSSLVHLQFNNSFASGISQQLKVRGIQDLFGNEIKDTVVAFTYTAPYEVRRFDVVIHEIMTDPEPPVALPPVEWIEITNTASAPINVGGWRLGTATTLSGPFPSYLLPPDSLLIICSAGSAVAMSGYGSVISVGSFPTLDNNLGQLHLLSEKQSVIHAVEYSATWYRNELKKQGGWSLEMIDANNPCKGEGNWQASTDARGGTPGKFNSIATANPDDQTPRLLHAYAIDSLNLVLVFNEPLDSSLAASARFSISDGIGPGVLVAVTPPLFKQVRLQLPSPMAANKVYTVTATQLSDCVGNAINLHNTTRVGLRSLAQPNDLVINEILFNPPPAGADYLEIYNRGNKLIDLSQIFVTNRNNSGVITNITSLSTEPKLIFPGDFFVLTENADWVRTTFVSQGADAIHGINQLPPWNDEQGTVVLLNAQGEIIDELRYSDKWHFKLLDRTEGVALERIDYHSPTQQADNWHSAASSVGYGTPGYKNSQYRAAAGVQGEMSISPAVVSPDNDGQDDITTISYQFPEAGYVANITIFDVGGRPIRYLQRNVLCGTTGYFRWDGLGEKNQRLPTGGYIVFAEIFNLKGQRKQFKLPVVVARRY